MRTSSGIQFMVWIVVMGIGGIIGFTLMPIPGSGPVVAFIVWVAAFLLACLAASAARVAAEWERAIVLRLGKFTGIRGPGFFFITPVLDSVPYVIDLRLNTTIFRAEQTMTRDTVPV
ncbi:MAG TPA: SPFH domain-containing protein, partial [Armatimonadota bacterium]|nr:SPFH domain-containing protein [Armatimonadota bacterium]